MGEVDGPVLGINVGVFVVGCRVGILLVGLKVGLDDGALVGALVVGDEEGERVVGVNVGATVGDSLGPTVGGVGAPLMHLPLSRLHAPLAHAISQTLLSCKYGGHPTAQSSNWRKVWAGRQATLPREVFQHGIVLTYDPESNPVVATTFLFGSQNPSRLILHCMIVAHNPPVPF